MRPFVLKHMLVALKVHMRTFSERLFESVQSGNRGPAETALALTALGSAAEAASVSIHRELYIEAVAPTIEHFCER